MQMQMQNMKKYIAECLGTCVLVVFACGTAILSSMIGGTALLIGTALAFGLALVAMVYTIGHISGCHINPAVSLAKFLTGELSLNDLIGYVAAQFAGALVGSAILAIILDDADYLELAANRLYDDDILRSIIIEIVLTFVFVLVVLAVTSRKENGHASGLVIGLTLTLVHIFGIPLTGTSVNPARSFGPALFGWDDAIGEYWVFLIAPLIGAALAAFTFKFLNNSNPRPANAPNNYNNRQY